MKSLILAAGYATRLYPLTLNTPKSLLPVGGVPTIELIIRDLEKINEIEQILVVTNDKFFQQFKDWQQQFSSTRPIKIINDGSTSEQDRLGAIGDINFVIAQEKIADDLLVIGGDNLFELGLREFIDFAKLKLPACSVGLHKLENKEEVRRYSQVTLDGNKRITEFIEKPKNPSSTLVAKCVYLFSKNELGLIADYIAKGNPIDAPGNYIGWLCHEVAVYGFTFSGKWYDIGNYQTYQQADRDFKERN
ncbi:MAG: nucleotidyltransferase family protein [Candidatus Omnitrophica bacterium]|nr:nucleotidyltransferase family protein [Candidatus Omnitrophota bacterium]